MTDPLARRERRELCDLALALGPDAPTLCEGWTAADLMAHLVVRERRPIASVGTVFEPLSGLAERAMARQQAQGYEVLVEEFRRPAPFLRAVPRAAEVMNGFELLVHHENLRRGGAEWQPRTFPDADLDLHWKRLARGIGLLGRRLPVPTEVARADTGARLVAKRGGEPVTVCGPVVELVLFLSGRSATRGLTFDGPEENVAALLAADLAV